jgi:putative redox protein
VLARREGLAIGAPAPTHHEEKRMSANTPAIVEVEETLIGRYMQTARTGHHALTVDEPKVVGGNDAGPGPYEYLLIGLGACTAMTLRMYAERKGLPLRRVHVRLSHLKIHAQDCADCETREGRGDEITHEIDREPLPGAPHAHLGDQGAFVLV